MFPTQKLLCFLLVATTSVNALWPQPRNIQTGSKALTLSPSFKISYSGHGAPSDLNAAIQQTEKYLKNDKLERLVVGRGNADAAAIKGSSQLKSLTLALGAGANATSISEEAHLPYEKRDEAYSLTIPDDGSAAKLVANSTLGLYRGLTTFSQLWYSHGQTTYALETPVTIQDSPAYPYRGLMLDTARNYYPVDAIKRQIDAMSWVKINTFHWHIVDSQSFPLVVPGFESLSQQGAYSPDYIYSGQDVKDVISYAAARGIDVMVEIDTPGHTSIIHKAFPEHIACAEATPWATYANEPPAGQLRLASANTTQFTANLLGSIADMFPESPYFSTGGDELNLNCYKDDQETQESLSASGQTFEQALDTFTQASHKVLIDKGKTPVVWEEMVLANNITLANDTVVMVWISSANAAAVAEKGFRIVHAPSDYFYLDCGGGGWVGNNTLGNSWCDPFKTWQKAYSFDPLANITSDQASLVLGGEQLLWAEQSSPNNAESTIWPRAAASAEVFWSGPGGDSSKALARLHDVAYRMENRGLHPVKLQPLWCALRPNACDLTA